MFSIKQLFIRLKICETDKCSFCNLEKETIHHLFYYCVHTRNLWLDLRQWLIKLKIYIPVLEEKSVLLGMTDILYVDKLILIIKRYIYVTRCVKDSLSIVSLKILLKGCMKLKKKLLSLMVNFTLIKAFGRNLVLLLKRGKKLKILLHCMIISVYVYVLYMHVLCYL